MIKRILAILSGIGLLVGPSSAFAVPNFANANLTTPGTERTLVLPQLADRSPVISLGSGIDPATGKKVEGLAFIHYKEKNAKPPWAGGGGKATKCYGFLATGAKWKTLESWLANPSNIRGLGNDFVFGNLTGDIAKWEDAADGVVGNSISVDILGNGSTTTDTLVADTIAPDNQNEIYFADVSSPGAIAVTIVWGIFGGPPSARELVEWDQVYDDVDYDWSAAGEAGRMDFENIATHELGHSVGLADLYTSTCAEETMYGYASYGETQKRDLNTGDIAGVNKLY